MGNISLKHATNWKQALLSTWSISLRCVLAAEHHTAEQYLIILIPWKDLLSSLTANYRPPPINEHEMLIRNAAFLLLVEMQLSFAGELPDC